MEECGSFVSLFCGTVVVDHSFRQLLPPKMAHYFAGLANPDSTIDKLILWVWEDSIKRGFTGDDDNASGMVIHPG
jgi:hypothetical protein